MTGFGQAGRIINGYKLQVDIKSVNHRYSEVVIRMPREWMRLEDSLKKTIQQTVKRGRVDAFITIERETPAEVKAEINWPLAEGYHQAAQQLRERFQFSDSLTLKDMLGLPDIVTFQHHDPTSEELLEQELGECLNEALRRLVAMREAEGAHMYAEICDRLRLLDSYYKEMLALSPTVVDEYRNKLRHRIRELLPDTVTFDEARLAMEIALFAERSDIDEELTRLQSHFQQCRNMLELDEPVGRKLDFLVQEMNREVNTIGSKANHTELINRVVSMKAEIEKIREQVQNIE